MTQYILKLFNTQTRKKEEILPSDGKTIRMYTCGPTIYDYAHIGNFRTYVFEDLLRRTLKFFGFEVMQVMNITDVDDKTIKGAIKNKVPLKTFTDPFKKAFFEDLKILNIEPAEFYPEATAYIGEMIKIIQDLLKKEIAYVGLDKSIYFSIGKFPNYGKLSRLNLKELQAGASMRVIADEYDKESVSDFVLWKSYDSVRDGDIYWDSPFGKGRPGWHIECSAMSLKLLGHTIDIHCGGIDNMFPHHENEIAQSECYTSKSFVLHWAHSEHLIVDGKKMSKSLGNFFTLRDILKKGYSGPQIRYMLLHTHYKSNLNFTFDGLAGAKNTLQRILDFINRLKTIKEEQEVCVVTPFIQRCKDEFSLALADDLNISSALASLFDFVRDINVLCDDKKIFKKDAIRVLEFLADLDKVIGCLSFNDEEVPQNIQEALDKRQIARKEKNFKKADELRQYIESLGYIIEDTPQGARVKKK
ncbi:MAG: cysteine--tRNA ligase [Chlamydiae bacterium]|nr:cysteine--tRNA ligase [Chlamydiota bacterium]